MQDLNEKCAVFGVFGNGENSEQKTAREVYFGLFALQHRGQEHSGIATTDGKRIYLHKDAGLVSQIYTEDIIKRLPGFAAIGHNRYSTSSGNNVEYAQPFIYGNDNQAFAFGHNGNLPSIKKLVDFLKLHNEETEDSSDSQLMAKAIGVHMKNGKTLPDAVASAYPLFTGAFSCVALGLDTMVAFRDPCGIRPLVLGKKDDQVIVSSETCALDTLGAEFVREIEPGEMIIITKDSKMKNKIKSKQLAKANPKFDIFEFIYFSRYDSIMLGKSVYEVRKNLGRILAREHKLKVDMVIPVPETAISAAMGFAEESKIPFEMGISKNRYINRTFIEPTQELRTEKVRMKLSPLRNIIKGKKIAVMDDSIVRGTTSKQIVKMLFDAGAKEVHFLVSSAPIKFPDFYGIDTPYQNELISSTKTTKEICKFLGATSLCYLSIEGMIEATGLPKNKLSLSCFDGVYPIPIHEREKEIRYNVPIS